MKYSDYFTTGRRADDKSYIMLSDDRPEELHKLVYEIHDGLFDALPNDWIYRVIMEALEELEENNNNREDCGIEGDCYTSDLLEWLGERYATECCNTALEELGPFTEIWEIVGAGNVLAKERIYDAVHHFLENNELEEEVE